MGLIIIYGITTVVALLLIAGYMKQIKERQWWFVFLYISVFVVNAGYFWLAASGTLESALMANRLAYMGSVFLPLCMLMITMDICRINCPKMIKGGLLCISVAVFLVAASGGITDWYYEEVSLTFVNGAGTLIKEYGPLHMLYYVYLFAYFLSMAAVIIAAWFKHKPFNVKHAFLMLALVFGNILIWLAEQGIDSQFECLSVSYIITEVFLLMLYCILQDIDLMCVKNDDSANSLETMSTEQVLKCHPELGILTAREMEVVIPLLQDKKRRDIAEELSVTEHTIKKHTAHIFAKFDVASRKELRDKLGIK